MAVLGLVGADAPNALPAAQHPGAFDAAPALAWAEPLPGPRVPAATHTELGAPVLHEGLIYIGSAADDALLVLDRRDGRLVRRLPAAGPVQAPALVRDGRIWFSDTGGGTWCYLLDGTLVWRHEGSSPVLSTPLVHQGQLYVANIDNVVTALDADRGEFLWRHAQRVDRLDSGPALYGAPSPTVHAGDDGTVLTGYSDGTLVALSRDAGAVAWQRRVGEGAYPDLIGAALDLGSTLVVGGYSGPLLALDPESRAVRWRVEVGSAAAPVTGAVDPASGLPALYHGGTDGVLRAIDARTGAVQWEWDSKTQGALTPPVLTDAGLLVGSSAGGLYLVDHAEGRLRWELDPGYLLAGVSASPAVDGRQAVVVTNGGRVLSLVVPGSPGPGDRGDGDHQRVTGPDQEAPRAGAPR